VLKDRTEVATDEELAALLALVREAKDFLDDRFHPDGYNIGEAAGARAAELSRRRASVVGVVRPRGIIAPLSPIILQSFPNLDIKYQSVVSYCAIQGKIIEIISSIFANPISNLPQIHV